MPSSLLFAGLVATWLAVLVPMAARRRQPMSRPSDAALSCRVLERPRRREQEVTPMDDATTSPRWSAPEPSEHRDRAPYDPESPPPRYRPGRGGYDPEAAAAAARAKYVFRQRVVLALGLLAVATGLFAGGLKLTEGWYVHAGVDLSLLGYLWYLRRQVRVERSIRARRAARMAGGRYRDDATLDDLIPDNLELSRYGHAPDERRIRRSRPRRRVTVAEEVAYREARETAHREEAGEHAEPGYDHDEYGEHEYDHDEYGELDDDQQPDCEAAEYDLPDGAEHTADPPESDNPAPDLPALPRLRPAAPPERPRGTVVLELDDEDPELHELDWQAHRGYRRAAGQ